MSCVTSQQHWCFEGILRVPRLAAFTRTYIMPRSVTTPRPSSITFQLSHNFWKMSAVPTRKIPSEDGKALKLACATCIQGHRASSCSTRMDLRVPFWWLNVAVGRCHNAKSAGSVGYLPVDTRAVIVKRRKRKPLNQARNVP